MLTTILFVMLVAIAASIFFCWGSKLLEIAKAASLSAFVTGLLAWALCAAQVSYQTSDREYWTGYVVETTYTEGHTETHVVTSTDSKGNVSYQTVTVHYPPYWMVYDTNGYSSITYESTYLDICRRFGYSKPATGGWSGRTHSYKHDGRRETNYPWTTTHYFKNPTLVGGNLFSYRDFSRAEVRELELPRWDDFQWNPVWRGPEGLSTQLEILNADLGKSCKVRVHMLFVPPDAGDDWPRLLEEYWKGGKKNELTIVVRVDADWNVNNCHVFGWSRCDSIKVAVREHICGMTKFDSASVLNKLHEQLVHWAPADFKEYDHIKVRVPTWLTILLCFAAVFISVAIVIKLDPARQ